MAGDRIDKNNLSWAKAFDKMTSDQSVQPEGVGWVLFKDLQKMLGIGQNRLHKFLREGTEDGRVEVFEGTKIGKNGRLVRKIWYRLK